jgi:hypothetical protein
MDKYTTEEVTKELIQSSKLPEPLHLAAMLEQTLRWPLHGKAADCLREMYAQAQAAQPAPTVQEPVCQKCGGAGEVEEGGVYPSGDLAYVPCECTTPPAQEFVCSTGLCHYKPAAQRPWVGLTDDEFRYFASTFDYGTGGLIRAIEAKLKEKNT